MEKNCGVVEGGGRLLGVDGDNGAGGATMEGEGIAVMEVKEGER